MTTMEKAEAAYNAIKVLAEHVGAREARRLLLKLRAGLDPVEDVLTGGEILYTEAELDEHAREVYDAAYDDGYAAGLDAKETN